MFEYLFKASLCAAVLLLLYRLFLEKEKMHLFNRFYLLFSLIFSFAVPFITITTYLPALPVDQIKNAVPEYIGGSDIGQSVAPVQSANYWPTILISIYSIVTLLLLTRFSKNIISLLIKIKRSEKIDYAGATLVLIHEQVVPHSFFGYIFINKAAFKDVSFEKEILRHELEHIKQRHSLDIVFFELLFTVAWINPVLWLYRSAIQLNHEFIADDAVINTYNNTQVYQHLLINCAGRQPVKLLLASQFSYSITKKRLIMMTKITSRRKSVLKILALVPVLVIAVIIFSNRVFTQTTPVVKQIESTTEGASADLMKEYAAIVEKYNRNKKQATSAHAASITKQERERLEYIFKQMSRQQQKAQTVYFIPPFSPMQKKVPTVQEMETWKNSKLYSVWIDNKQVDNAVLNNYSNEDFDGSFVISFSILKLDFGNRPYLVSLMTRNCYEKYYAKTIANTKNSMCVVFATQ